MKVKIIKTNEVKDLEAGYAVRLIEQGMAKPLPPEPAAKEKATKPAAGSK